ncbi:MAG TPA: hypothetical protein VHO06_26365, partial [Polyangia bacterium]|nr:hypothetical protein [Polyangia bacterium]
STGGSSGSGGTGAGSGGATGSGGTGTGGSSATGSGGTGSGGSGATTFFTDGFESDTVGQQPAGFDSLIDYVYKGTNSSSSEGALVDGTHVHGGSKAVHFAAQGGQLMTFLEYPLPVGTNHLYLRVYVYLATAIGDEPASSNDNHETLIALTQDPSNANQQIRFGQIFGALGTNESVTDNIAPITADWNMGAQISAATWHCLEVEFDGTAAYNALRAYSDGTLVHAITSAADWAHSPGLAADWMSGHFVDVALGWQSFSSMKNDVWMDDLAMSTTGRIGCN